MYEAVLNPSNGSSVQTICNDKQRIGLPDKIAGVSFCLLTEIKLLLNGVIPGILSLNDTKIITTAQHYWLGYSAVERFVEIQLTEATTGIVREAVVSRQLAKVYQDIKTCIDDESSRQRKAFNDALQVIEKRGIPLDGELLQRLRRNKNSITSALCALLDATCPFSRRGKIDTIFLSKFIKQHNLLWPVTKDGRLKIDVDTLEEMALSVPCLRAFVPNYKLLKSLMREKLELGADNRVRCPARPFATKTGRNAPSSNAYILSLSKHYRSLIQPAPGRALAVIDFCSQDIGIAAALSGDANLLEDYLAEDVYISFLVRSGRLPMGASKASHPLEREIAKVVMLGLVYGMTPYGVACRLKITEQEANHLIEAHQQRYSTLWQWQNNIIDTAPAHGLICSQSGWSMRVDKSTKKTTLKNWPIQATGADILRQAVLLCQQSGVEVIATDHDALMVESDLNSIERIAKQTSRCMADASKMVIGVALKTESSICKFPNSLYPQQRAELEQLLNALR